MSAVYFAAFETNQKENVSMEKSKLPRKGLNIIMFCKAQLNAEHMLQKSPNRSFYMLINVMLIKKACKSGVPQK